MLYEILDTRQIPDEGFRRWFTDEQMDLIVWYTVENGPVTGFQLCYDKDKHEKALTWTNEKGFKHEKVDNGEEKGYSHKGSPVLVPDGEFRPGRVLEQFDQAAVEIDAPLRRYVREVLGRYSTGGSASGRHR